jgi:hypothetical protein
VVYESTSRQAVVSAPPADATTIQPALVRRKRRRTYSTRAIVLLSLAAGFLLGAPVAASAAYQHNGSFVPVVGPTAADAERECKSATETLAQQHLDDVMADESSSGVGATVIGVEVGHAEEASFGWTVDGTIRYNLVSFLGNIPITLYVTCEASVKDGDITTDVHKR